MKTNRELLELAAKAYWGDEIDDVVSVEWSEQDASILYTHGENQDHNGQDRTYRWNPLEESADALQMVAKLKLHIGMESNVANAWARDDYGNFQTVILEHFGEEAALRRAIVLAAAAVAERAAR